MKNGLHIPYEGFSVTDMELFWLTEKAKTMESVVEIGSFKGRSTYGLALGCKTVYAVDTFQYGTYHDFVKNILEDFPNINVMYMSSKSASKRFDNKSIDMIFIDGEHYEEVQMDIDAWLPKCKKLICGHDYNTYFSKLKRAVDSTFGEKVQVFENIWFVYL